MSKRFGNFVKNLEKLENYCVLSVEGEDIIVGSKIDIKEYQDFTKHIFHPRAEIKQKKFPVFFLITTGKTKKLKNFFESKELPILFFNNQVRNLKEGLLVHPLNFFEDEIENILDSFVKKTFLY